LILCASMSGGPRATYANPSIIRVMRDLDGLSPEDAARRIWKVTYSPAYLERHRAVAEDQMRREIASPTPLHAADLQFQALAEFDCSNALVKVRCPTLILTGDLDELVPPQNSIMMANLIPDAELVIMPGRGHRVFWETTEECAGLIINFLTRVGERAAGEPRAANHQAPLPTAFDPLTSAFDLFMWPFALAKAGFESLDTARQALIAGGAPHFGDGKPIILVPHFFGSDFALLPLSMWLMALGYRPVTAGFFINVEESSAERSLSQTIRDVTGRVGRKAVLISHSSGMTRALRAADTHRQLISDVIVFGAPDKPETDGIRTHFMTSLWPVSRSMTELARLLRGISIELLDVTGVLDDSDIVSNAKRSVEKARSPR
jgi:pimeloyl-ACP methyl ester carboxylesterase